MTNPTEFIVKIKATPPEEREELFEDEFPDEVLKGYLPDGCETDQLLGCHVTDIIVDGGTVSATFCLTYISRSTPDEDGQYQDEDGDNFSFPEKEYVIGITITDKGVELEIA